MPLSNDELGDYLASLERILEGDPAGQDAALGSYRHKLEAFAKTGDHEPIEVTLRLLGTAVGGQKRWQTPFRESGILAYALQGLSVVKHTDPIAKQCLRVIGNSVADHDANREFAIKDLKHITGCLASPDLRTTALAVLFNLCNDFDPAKAAVATLRLDATISAYLVLDRIPEAGLDYATDLLTWTTGNLTDVQFKDDVSLETFKSLLNVALQYDEDHYLEYVAILVHHLQDPEFQQKVATPKMLDDLVVLMLDLEARLEPQEIEDVFQELATSKDAENTTSEEAKVLLLAQLIGSISAASSTDAFAQRFNIRSPVVERLESKLRAPWDSAFPSTICACVMLGNLAMSDEVCVDMVKIMELHLRLISILRKSNKPALLYAAAGFMRHLTFPEANRAVLADAGLMEACCRLLALEDPSVRGEAAAMLCKLVTNNFHNIEKVMYETVGEDTNTADAEISADTVIFIYLVEQALVPSAPLPSTTMKNSMIELGRTLVAMLRYLGRPNAEKDVEAVQIQILQLPLIVKPIAQLVRQRFYPEARSEGLLGLGLLAQTLEGAAYIADEIKEDSKLLEAIKEYANTTDAETSQQVSSSTPASRDHQNAIVLLQALQNNAVRELQEAVGEVLRTSRVTKWTEYSRIRRSLSKNWDNSWRRPSGDKSVVSSPVRSVVSPGRGDTAWRRPSDASVLSPGRESPGRLRDSPRRSITDFPARRIMDLPVRVGDASSVTPSKIRASMGGIEGSAEKAKESAEKVKDSPAKARLTGKGMKRTNTAPG
ncbi:ARM repeat-containing protein [Clathrospora elynae]|uniref:ARM repeat-containing protein n=1 Tax=Clathrospora elynae TaxID=706981 RepID=A0A6A5TFM7_9PLEO|nr:ARM repeat-containing protein [Clathrospora elynae]